MAVAAPGDVVAQDAAVIGVGAVLDDDASALGRSAGAKVRNALVGDDHRNGMLAAIQVTNHGDNGADLAALGCGGANEHGKKSGPGEIGRATDPVHHVFAQHV